VTREEKIAKARELKAAGVPLGVIAESLEVPHSTSRGWALDTPWPKRECLVCGKRFAPDHGNQKVCCGENARKRFHEERTRAACIDCGKKLGTGSGYPSRAVRCRICHELSEAERCDVRRRQIEAWWTEGLQLPEIADRLGWTKNHLSVEVNSMRRLGYLMPYRHRGYDRFPDQVAA
jgi:hypothetical protein